MAQISQFCGAVESVSPESAGFAISGGKATMPLYLLQGDLGAPPSLSDIQDAITDILGSVSTDVGDGRLNRTMPLAHPVFPWLTASGITSIKGIGAPAKISGSQQLEVAPLAYYAEYPNLEFTVEFSPRPDVLAQDQSIPLLEDQTFYDESDKEQTTVIAGEWCRFAWFVQKPQYDTITAKFGNMTFITGSGNQPQGFPFAGMPKLPLPNAILQIYWTQVPYRYILSKNSFLARFAGYINQNAWASWQPGQLLYLGCTAKPYTPPVPEIDTQYTGSSGNIFSAEKWCDLELNFLLTTRQGLDLPTPTDPPTAPLSNRNYVPAGHNLQPNIGASGFKRGYYYTATSSETSGLQQPTFPSTELALLFTDPDAEGVYQFPDVGAE